LTCGCVNLLEISGLSSKYTLPPTCLVVLKLNMVLALLYSHFDHRLQAPSSNSFPDIHKVINYIFKLLTYSTGKNTLGCFRFLFFNPGITTRFLYKNQQVLFCISQFFSENVGSLKISHRLKG